MLFAKGARMMAEDNKPKDATLRELLDETHNAILQAVGNGEYSTSVIIRRFVPREVRKEYKQKMRPELPWANSLTLALVACQIVS